jgi:uncharacterized protein (TIGR00252 family)
MSSTSTGREAEAAVAAFLNNKGYKVLEQNWRTRWCEIDLVAQKKKTIYFVEVKYRQSNSWGNGLEYITAKKLEQMRFAAEFWVSTNSWSGKYQLAAAAVSGADFVIDEWIESIDL